MSSLLLPAPPGAGAGEPTPAAAGNAAGETAAPARRILVVGRVLGFVVLGVARITERLADDSVKSLKKNKPIPAR